jgi:dolichol-phosphate mannosyltransferase
LNVESMLRALRNAVPSADVLVVDDGSPDGTAKKAIELAEELGSVAVLQRSEKSGLGGAYRAGFSWGLERGYDHFVEIDCYVKGGHIPQWTFLRRFISRGGNQYASIMLGLKVADSTAGFRVYSKSALEKMDFATVSANGYGFQIEMTYRARRAGLSIIEVPISFTDRELGESKMSGAIVGEALVLVTQWALLRPFGRAPR